MDLKEMLQRTTESLKENSIIEEKQIKQEAEKVEARTTTEYDIDSREVEMILSLGLKIDKFTPQDTDGNYYDAE